MNRNTFLSGMLALLATAAAAADLQKIEWRDARSEATFDVAARKFAEWCGKLAKGEKVEWQFEASGPVDFNVHYHEGKNVNFPEKRAAIAAATGTLEVPVDQDYCWMWSNTSTNATVVRARLKKLP